MIDLNKKRSTKEWQNLLNSVKVSDLEFSAKSKLIEDIEFRLNGRRYTDKEVLKEIKAGMADIDDLM